MKFKDIIKMTANVGMGILLGPGAPPIFAQDTTKPIIPQNTSNKIVAAIAMVEKMTTQVENMKNMSGSDKLAAAVAMTQDAIMMSSALTGSEIEDAPRFQVGVAKITDGWNDVIKSVKKK